MAALLMERRAASGYTHRHGLIGDAGETTGVTLRKRVSGIDETIRRPVVIEAQRIRCSLFVRVPAAKNGAETVGVSNPDRVSIQAHTSLFRAALARMPLRVSTFISPPDADAVWR